jgi:NitT/TauT family transport system substrate-binding protein
LKKAFAVFIVLALLGFLSGALAEPLRVAALKGPTAMGLVKLMKDSEGGEDYAFTLAASPDAVLPGLLRGEIDAACLPVNLAPILYANTGGAVRVVNINTLGVLYILERGVSVSSLSDLSGRRLYASGKSSTPEYVLEHLLHKAGIDNVEIRWKAEHSEVLAALLRDPAGLALLPQPFVTVAQGQDPDIRIALDLNLEWEALGEGSLITGVTVIRAELLDSRPDVVARFLADYEASAAYVNANHKESAALIGHYGILDASAAEKALPYCGITSIAGEEMKAMLARFYGVLFSQNPDSVGGAMPDEGLYAIP